MNIYDNFRMINPDRLILTEGVGEDEVSHQARFEPEEWRLFVLTLAKLLDDQADEEYITLREGVFLTHELAAHLVRLIDLTLASTAQKAAIRLLDGAKIENGHVLVSPEAYLDLRAAIDYWTGEVIGPAYVTKREKVNAGSTV